jgi:multidrug efflux pump subunit AcrA (membrane-fusion protein)
MAVIGATGLEPVNILGSYVQGMELGRANRLAQQQQAAQMQAAQQEAALRNYLSTADLESPEAQNQLLRFGAPGATLAKTLGEMRNADLTRQKTMTEIEAAGFKRERDLLASVNDQSTYDTWRQGALQTY